MYNKIGEIMKKANKLEVKEFTEEQIIIEGDTLYMLVY